MIEQWFTAAPSLMWSRVRFPFFLSSCLLLSLKRSDSLVVYRGSITDGVAGSIPVSCCLCVCFDRTLGGWAWFFLSSWLPLRSCCFFLGFCPPREAGAALMLTRAPAGVGQRRSDVGPYINRHRKFGSAEEGRSCAEASTLFSRHGGGERTLVIYAKESHRRYKVDH